MCKNIGPSLQFIRQFGPALRFYNPGLKVLKNQDPQGPISMNMQVFRKNSQEPIEVSPQEFKSTEQLLAEIKKIDSLN